MSTKLLIVGLTELKNKAVIERTGALEHSCLICTTFEFHLFRSFLKTPLLVNYN